MCIVVRKLGPRRGFLGNAFEASIAFNLLYLCTLDMAWHVNEVMGCAIRADLSS